MEEYIEGAGGTSELALLLLKHVDVSLAGFMDDSQYLLSALGFLNRAQVRNGALRPALLAHGMMRTHTGVLAALGRSADPCQGFAREMLINYSLVLLPSFLCAEPMPRHAIQALKAGLLSALINISLNFTDAQVLQPLEYILKKILPAAMAHYSVLWRMVTMLSTLGAVVASRPFKASRMYPFWRVILEVAVDRLPVLTDYEAVRESMRACDNGPCSKIGGKSAFSRCSGCYSVYYCSAPCQKADWRLGRHREACATLHASRHTDLLRGRELSFMRALVHADYLAQRTEILCLQIGYLNQRPDVDIYLLFWYTEGKVDIKIYRVGVYPPTYDWGIDWAYWARRKRASGGRMELHLVVTTCWAGGTCARMIPRRCRDARVSEGLARIAALPMPRGGEDVVGDMYEPLVIALKEEDEGSIH
ncbi:hypothetical protein B0H15DRAFT_464592 [Mycena belliarum]|uniref:MYND-type domain-containing protein n=1 Tax=Mycena belliarum TaxID=1033014 RepID=A0AAD6UJJ7_9AGAR|nr:hypothetical protein B0H15DRAFT_464592 [Mycena belliae]